MQMVNWYTPRSEQEFYDDVKQPIGLTACAAAPDVASTR